MQLTKGCCKTCSSNSVLRNISMNKVFVHELMRAKNCMQCIKKQLIWKVVIFEINNGSFYLLMAIKW